MDIAVGRAGVFLNKMNDFLGEFDVEFGEDGQPVKLEDEQYATFGKKVVDLVMELWQLPTDIEKDLHYLKKIVKGSGEIVAGKMEEVLETENRARDIMNELARKIGLGTLPDGGNGEAGYNSTDIAHEQLMELVEKAMGNPDSDTDQEGE
jgi:hypothetical protein